MKPIKQFESRSEQDYSNELRSLKAALTIEHNERAKRDAEFVIATTELTHQNAQKEKRANELLIANKELVFQNQKKVNTFV